MDTPGQRAKSGAIGVHFEVHGHGEVGSAVIGVIEGCNLCPTGRPSRNLDSILYRLSA